MDLNQYWKATQKRLWLITLIVMIALTGAAYYVLNQPLLYRTSTTLVINPATLDSTVNYQLTDGLLPLANTYSEFMHSASFARTVSTKLQTQQLPIYPTEGQITDAIIARYVDGTQLFRITATFYDPFVAKALADTTAQMLVEANMARIQAEQTALMNAQMDTRRVQEVDRLTELTTLLRDELKYHEDRIQALDQQLAVLNSNPPSTETDAQILETRNELLSSRSARVDLLGSLANAQQSLLEETEKESKDVDTVVVVDEALVPEQPLPRNIIQPLLAAIAAALGLGIVVAVGLEFLDTSAKTPEELDLQYGLSTLGVIGIAPKPDNSFGPTGNLVMLYSPSTPLAESIRVLRTAVRIVDMDKPLRSLLITSAKLGEGKTFIATNLAISMAQAGKRVILVDADLRRPQIHKAFGIRAEPGLTNLVVEERLSLAQVLQPTRVPNLRILASGTLSPNPAELLGSERASALMQKLVEEADMVIYDSSPATTVTDAVIISSQVDGVIQVVNARGSRMALVLRCKELLERSGAYIIGPVLNRVAVADLGYYSNYYKEGQEYMAGRKSNNQGVNIGWPPPEVGKRRRQPLGQSGTTVETISQVEADSNGHASSSATPGSGATRGGEANDDPYRPHQEK